MFRRVETKTQGALYLHSMPGRYDALTDCIAALKECEVMLLVRLTGDEEVGRKSPSYLDAIKSGRIPVDQLVFPVPDFGVPVDKGGFYGLAENIACRLKKGANVLVHCAGGISRTGMFAGCVVKALGEPLKSVKSAGSWPETDAQMAMVKMFVMEG